MNRICVVIATALACSALQAQESGERVTVPLSDPARPATVKVEIMAGSVSVRAGQTKDVIVSVRGTGVRRHTGEVPQGMRRLDLQGSPFQIEQQNNVVEIDASPHAGNLQVELEVPANTSLNLRCAGPIKVEGVSGEIDVEAMNGGVALTNVSGAVVAHSMNGPLNAVFDRVTGTKPMSFSTMNGPIDVTFPADLKANVKLKSENGEVFTDFDVQMKGQPAPSIERGQRGRFRYENQRTFVGAVNGGGPEYQFTTMNGRIFIRKHK